MKRLLCHIFGHQFIIPHFGSDGTEIGKFCWRCQARWPQ